jgi:hypothetical protein
LWILGLDGLLSLDLGGEDRGRDDDDAAADLEVILDLDWPLAFFAGMALTVTLLC